MIEVKNITKNFGSFTAVNNVSFQMSRGDVVGFLGPNGAGKTTTMRILTGYLPPATGECLIGGFNISTQSLEARKKIGYLPESAALYGEMEVTDYLRYVATIRKLTKKQIDQRLKEIVLLCGLKQAVGKKIAALSKGFRQRVGLAQTLIHDPDVLVLDEPTVGLDPNQIVEIRNLIKEIGQRKTILLSTHILSEVEQTCQKVVIISEGTIVAQGTPQELMSITRGASVYYLKVRAAGSEIQESIKLFPHFRKIDFIKSENNLHRISVAVDSQEDLSEDFFKLAVSKNWSLLELRREEMTLEEVFKKLTK